MTVSHWHDSREQLETNVCVIGAGIAGLAAAHTLQHRRVDALVVDRHDVASGASGRNAGFLMRGAADHYDLAIARFGRDNARALWQLSEDNLRLLTEWGADTLPSFRRVPSCLLALHDDDLQHLHASHQALTADGFTARWLDDHPDTLWRTAKPRAGLVNPDDAVCNPVHLLRHLAAQLTRPPRLHDEVHAIDAADRVTIHTRTATIRAQRAILCTNAFTPLLLDETAQDITPKRGQMLALRARGRTLDHAYYANAGSEYLRQTDPHTIIVGGCRTRFADSETGYEDRTTPEVQRALEAFARDTLGDPVEVTARWAGTMGFSSNGLPIVRQSSSLGPAVWICAGFTGHGMSLAAATARAAVHAMLDDTTPPFAHLHTNPPRSTLAPDPAPG